jgi:hypothetical protein
MSRLIRCSFLPLVLASIFIPAATAQSPQKSCPAPPAILTPTQPNIFSEQQEQWLGDATADQIERSYKIVKDPAENEYLTRIANRLLAALPPTKLQFRVVLVDMPVVNAFSIAGGRVYISRKLVANARNEDEVASVIGHEMGHILSHQFGIETTADLKRLLNITSVGDKADVYAKFQLLIDARMKDKHPTRTGNSDEGQDQADTVSAYAIAAAGYRPQAFSEFWDRMFFVDGKVGGPLSDFFGVTKPQEKRLRAILKLVNSLPPGCGASEPSNSPEFQKWQTLVTANQPTVQEPNVKPAAEVALNPPLRMQLEGLHFSRDGKYLLAQDESSIFVLSRDPYKPLFRFDAEGAQRAEFSPDSQHIVFQTPGLHTEEWSIPDRKLVASHELNTKQPCAQSKISPDGQTIFCISFATEMGRELVTDLDVLDASTGKVLYEKKSFFVPSFGFYIEWLLSQEFGMIADFIPSSVSADGNFMLIGPSEEKLAFDLRTRTPVSIGKDLKNNVSGAYAFLGNDKIVGVAKANVKDSGVFSFPEGKRIDAVPFGLTDLGSVSSGNFVVSHNIEGYAVGLVDVSAAKFVVASKAPSIDVWDGSLLNENADGSVVLHKLGDKTVPDQTATLPISPLGPVITSISDDGSLLAISTRTRGGVWNLATGERVLLARRFNAAVFYPDNSVYIEFAKQDKEERAIVHFTFSPFAATPVTYKEEKTAALTHSGLQEWKRSEDKKSVELIARDPRDNSVLWRRTYATAQFAHTSSTIVPGQIIAAFTLKSDFAKSRLSDSPALANEAAAVQNRDKGGLVQVIDSSTGNVLHEIVLEIPLDYEGLQGIHVFGDSLYLTGRANRTIVYSLATGKSGRQFFGTLVAADPSSKRICLMNRRDEAMVYNARGQQLADYEMGSPIRFATFQGAGNRLILLTANQKVRTMAITDTPAP